MDNRVVNVNVIHGQTTSERVVDLDWLYINGKISEAYYKEQLEKLNEEES